MTKKDGYYRGLSEWVIELAVRYGKLSNRFIALNFEISEATVRQYRKDYPEFDLTIREARDMLSREFIEFEMSDDSRFEIIRRKRAADRSTIRKRYSSGVPLVIKRKTLFERKAQLHTLIQSCKRRGMTQDETARHVKRSLSTVKRYWANKKSLRQKKAVTPLDRILRQHESGVLSALQAAQMIEGEGLPVPPDIWSLARKELRADDKSPK